MMLDIPPELLCEIIGYIGPIAYRILQDNFNNRFNVDTQKVFVKRYYADYIDEAIKGMTRRSFLPRSIIFHLQDTIKTVMIDKEDPSKIMSAMIKHCPYVTGHIKVFIGEILIVKTDTLDMEYINRLHFEKRERTEDNSLYLLHDSMYKLMPTLGDEIQTKRYNFEISKVFGYTYDFNREECQKIIDLYKNMTVEDFTCYYGDENGEYTWNIIAGLTCKLGDFSKLEKLTHNLLDFKVPVHDELDICSWYKGKLYDKSFLNSKKSFLNSKLNVFIPLSRIEEFDEKAIISCLKTKWLETNTIPLHELEFNSYIPYVAGGSLVRAILNSSSSYEDKGWEGSDWDLYLLPDKYCRKKKVNIDDIKGVKRNCNERCITYGNKIYEMFETSCEINCVNDTIDGKKREDFFTTVFPDCNRSDHQHLQIIIMDTRLYNSRIQCDSYCKMEHLVRTFDMAPCQIFWDGDHIYASILALYCLKNMINVCCSNTTDSRIDKYERRGFTTHKVDASKPNSSYMIIDDTDPQWKFV